MPTFIIKFPWFNESSQGWGNIILHRLGRQHRGGGWMGGVVDEHRYVILSKRLVTQG